MYSFLKKYLIIIKNILSKQVIKGSKRFITQIFKITWRNYEKRNVYFINAYKRML